MCVCVCVCVCVCFTWTYCMCFHTSVIFLLYMSFSSICLCKTNIFWCTSTCSFWFKSISLRTASSSKQEESIFSNRSLNRTKERASERKTQGRNARKVELACPARTHARTRGVTSVQFDRFRSERLRVFLPPRSSSLLSVLLSLSLSLASSVVLFHLCLDIYNQAWIDRSIRSCVRVWLSKMSIDRWEDRMGSDRIAYF